MLAPPHKLYYLNAMPLYAILAAIVVAVCWGGNFSASKFAMQEFPPFLTVLLRFVAVSLLLAPLALRRARPPMKPMLIIAFLLIVVHFAFIFLAMKMGLTITSAIVSTQLGIPFACIVSAILYKDYLGPWRSFGLMVAFVGVMIVAGTPNAAEHWDAFLLCTVGALAWSAANIYMKQLPPQTVTSLLFWPGLLALPALLFLTLAFESNHAEHLMHAGLENWLGIAYSTIFSSLIGYGLWNWLITKYPLSSVVPYSLLTPVAGITGGVLLFDEPFTLQIVLGAALAIVGVGIITLRRPKLAELEKF